MAEDIGKKLREQRVKCGLTQRDVANAVGVTEATVSRWESGHIDNMRRDKIANLAKVLKVSPLFIMDGSDDSSPAPYKPQLTDKDERDIQKKLSNILDGLDSEAGLAYYNGDEPMDEETRELLRLSLENSLRMAKLRAKERFTPKKYWNKSAQTPDDTATRIGKKVLDASPAAQAAVSEIIRDDEKDK